MIDNIFLGGVKAKALYVGTSLVWSGSYNPSPYNPSDLFGSGQQGTLYKYFDIANLFQDTSGTTPVTADGDPVGLVLDNSGNGINATQSVSSKRMTYSSSPPSLYLDKVDDELIINVPTGGWVGTMVLATTNGTASYGIDIPAGDYILGGKYFSSNNIVGALFRDGALTTSEKTEVESYFVDNGALADYGAVTDFYMAWRDFTAITDFPLIDTSSATKFPYAWDGCSSLTSFPLIDTSNAIVFTSAWNGCSSLTSFPLIDTSSAAGYNNFSNTWSYCSSLTSFPANMFDNIKKANFRYAFYNTNLNQESIDGILVSLVTSGITGTIEFHQSGGSAPSATGNTAIDTLRSRGWDITVTGGY